MQVQLPHPLHTCCCSLLRMPPSSVRRISKVPQDLSLTWAAWAAWAAWVHPGSEMHLIRGSGAGKASRRLDFEWIHDHQCHSHNDATYSHPLPCLWPKSPGEGQEQVPAQSSVPNDPTLRLPVPGPGRPAKFSCNLSPLYSLVPSFVQALLVLNTSCSFGPRLLVLPNGEPYGSHPHVLRTCTTAGTRYPPLALLLLNGRGEQRNMPAGTWNDLGQSRRNNALSTFVVRTSLRQTDLPCHSVTALLWCWGWLRVKYRPRPVRWPTMDALSRGTNKSPAILPPGLQHLVQTNHRGGFYLQVEKNLLNLSVTSRCPTPLP